MTIVLHDYRELEERASRHLNAWKAWHLILYALAAIFGIMNYVFLQSTMQLVDNNCVLYPRQLEFRLAVLPYVPETIAHNNNTKTVDDTKLVDKDEAQNSSVQAERLIMETNLTKNLQNDSDTELSENEYVAVTVNETHRLVLDTSRSLFGWENECEFAEYMPIVSMIFAAAWATFFTMCPGGGYSRSGLQQPWRILTPALLFALVMVGLTGHSFTTTNSGLYAFCSSFYNITNTTTCSSVDPYIQRSWGQSWGFGGRAASARASSAGVWASWACGAALLLARCLVAPDFHVQRTSALLKDPHQKITPYLKRSTRHRPSSASPNKRDNVSTRSEPTATTELVTVSVEQGQGTTSSSLQDTPVKRVDTENIEMTTTPQKL